MKLTKRSLLAGLGGLFGWSQVASAASLLRTPRQTEGPFYPRAQDMPDDRDSDLVRIAGKVIEAGGEILHLAGTLTDTKGTALAGARIEIWQCDVNGRYLHGADNALSIERDAGFQGFGVSVSDDAGRFAFRTIKPVAYPGRTPHIHAKVYYPDGRAALTTQLYIAGDPGNARDGLYRRLSKAEQAALTLELHPQQNREWQAKVAIVV